MSEGRKWVQYKNDPQGKKWEVDIEGDVTWRCCQVGLVMTLPKSEYVICEPPEEWEDVTDECQVQEYVMNGMTFWSIIHSAKTGVFLNVLAKENGYRVSKNRYGAFLIERRKP